MNPADPALEAIRQASFDWVTRLDDVWSPAVNEAPPIQDSAWKELQSEVHILLTDTEKRRSRLGRVMTGSNGTGKTHLLGRVRRDFMRYGGFFVLVDCTDLKDFWPSVLLNLVNSLHRPLDDHWSQWGALRYHLTLPFSESHEECLRQIELTDPDLISQAVQFLIDRSPSLSQAQSRGITNLSSALRAIFFTTSPDPELREVGTMWLQGIDLDESDARRLRLRSGGEDKDKIKAISYVTQTVGPTVFAFDQLDSLIATHHIRSGPNDAETSSDQRKAQAIIEGLGGGIMGLYDHSYWSITLLSCLTSSWEVIEKQVVVASAKERFSPAIIRLGTLGQVEAASTLVRSRLDPAYHESAFTPPYATYPFSASFLKESAQLTPRQLLQRCDQHVRACLQQGVVVETGTDSIAQSPASNEPLEALDLQWQQTLSRAKSQIQGLLGEIAEDTLGRLLFNSLSLLRFELSLPHGVEMALDSDFSSTRHYPSLHTRIRLIFHDQNEREEHLSLRVLEKTNQSAFRARLGAAMVESGIDRDLPARRLVLFRNAHLEIGGDQTAEMLDSFHQAGGVFLPYQRDDIAKLRALLELSTQHLSGWESWMKERQWISTSSTFSPLIALLNSSLQRPTPAQPPASLPTKTRYPQPDNDKNRGSRIKETPSAGYSKMVSLYLGQRVEGDTTDDRVHLPLKSLSKHAIVRAGSGGGKTVLLKRITEEAALAGVSSVVLDPTNDLAEMAHDWTNPPEGWTSEDSQRVQRFRQSVDTVVYTPGLKAGNSIHLPLLPDFRNLGDEDDVDFAVGLSLDSLRPLLISTRGAKANRQLGLLAATLRYFASTRMHGVDRLITLLMNLPAEVRGGIHRAEELAAELGNNFRTAIQNQPDLVSEEHLLNFDTLYGLKTQKPQISIINFTGLATLESQQQFINRLSVALFSWMKQHPCDGPSGLTGLLVIDEAKHYLPANRSAPCKTNLMRFCSHAHKYGLGLVLATENPNDMDPHSVSHFSTQFFGRANSPQVIDSISRLLEKKGGDRRELSRLDKGQFYVSSGDGIAPPLKIQVPMSLTAHSDGLSLTSDQVAALARESEGS